jgi:hypothetical protein
LLGFLVLGFDFDRWPGPRGAGGCCASDPFGGCQADVLKVGESPVLFDALCPVVVHDLGKGAVELVADGPERWGDPG